MKKTSVKLKRNKIPYSKSSYEAPHGKVTKVDDFLPPPEELFKGDDKVKITIEIDGFTLDFFREHANKMGGKYQRLIREVLRQYAKKYSA